MGLNILRGQLNLWYSCKECYWKQMSRDQVLKDIDRNTKYFQMMASIKRRRTLMVEIKKERRMLRDPRSIKDEVRRYFKNLYSQQVAPFIEFEEGTVNKISLEHARLVEVIPSGEEIKEAVWSCYPSKAPSADSFNLNFV